MLETLPRRAMGVQGRALLDRGPVLGYGDSISDGPDAISSSTYNNLTSVNLLLGQM